MDQTERLALPLLNAAQLQKELWHNESLLRLDGLICGRLAGQALTEPPGAPLTERWYRVAAGATGDWSSREGQIATWGAGGWRYLTPFDGLEMRDVDDGERWSFRDGDWTKGVERASMVLIGGAQVLGPRGADIADPAGGSVVDAECREAIRALLAAVRAHGLIG